MLPPLPPNVSLASRPSGSGLSTHTNFSRPLGGGGSGLASSKSMTYLDPPGLGTGVRRSLLSRSTRLGELSGLGDDEQKEVAGGSMQGKGKGKEAERGGLVGEGNWSPWKERYAGQRMSMTPTKRTPSRLAENRDVRLSY
jgi:hypothetical protein